MVAIGKQFLFFLFILLALSTGLEAATLKIASTLLPVSDMVREIAGDSTDVLTILPSGANPHTFELSPQMIKEIDGAAVIFRIGSGFDDWIGGISENLPAAKVVLLNENVQLINGDPHYWLSVRNAKMMAEHIARVLSETDSSNQMKYQANLRRYLSELDRADQAIAAKLTPLIRKEIVTFHDGWRYFARDYDLTIVTTIESPEGKEPTPRRLMELHKIINQNDIGEIFIEPALPRSLVDFIAEDFDVDLVELDPFGVKAENQKFINLMLNNSDQIAKALGNV